MVDTWWQTETGAILISPLPGATTLKPGSATFPLPAVGADVVDDRGNRVPVPGGGYLVLTRPWPAMLRGIWGDPDRYRDTYWSRFEGKYFAGDGAKRDEESYYWLLGRVDDVMLVSGHNISTAEVEHALVGNAKVAEAAVIGRRDPTTGQSISAFVILRAGNEPSDELAAQLQRVLRDGSLVNAYRQRAQKRVREHYDWERVVDRYEQLFARLAGQPALDMALAFEESVEREAVEVRKP